jgi:hypothetical protein
MSGKEFMPTIVDGAWFALPLTACKDRGVTCDKYVLCDKLMVGRLHFNSKIESSGKKQKTLTVCFNRVFLNAGCHFSPKEVYIKSTLYHVLTVFVLTVVLGYP